jgi:hypothetical protein
MQVIEMIDERLKKMETQERIKMGTFAFLQDRDSSPYRISTSSPYIGNRDEGS